MLHSIRKQPIKLMMPLREIKSKKEQNDNIIKRQVVFD